MFFYYLDIVGEVHYVFLYVILYYGTICFAFNDTGIVVVYGFYQNVVSQHRFFMKIIQGAAHQVTDILGAEFILPKGFYPIDKLFSILIESFIRFIVLAYTGTNQACKFASIK